MAIPKRLRYEVLRRDNFACRYCGATAPEVKLTVDHVVPEVLGGRTEPENLVTACTDCNSGKSSASPDEPLVDDVVQDALRWSKAMTAAHAAARLSLADRISHREHFREQIWNNWTDSRGRPVELPAGWEDAIDRFAAAGIDSTELTEAARLAMVNRPRDRFRYMCGILWKWVGERQEMALLILSEDAYSTAQKGIIQDWTRDCWRAPYGA